MPMKAVVYHMPKDMRVDEVDDPRIEQDSDAIIRVTSTAICWSDLHIYNGMFPQIRNMVMGHEFMWIVEETGTWVTNLKKGDRVIVPFPIACWHCRFCQHHSPVSCENSNPDMYWPEGDMLAQKWWGIFWYTDLYGGYNGGQAEFVRVPYADVGPRKVPEGLTDEQVLFLTDIFPTWWAWVDRSQLKGGETVAVIGAGPVWIMAMKAARIKWAGRVIGVDILDYRLEVAAKTAKAEVINGEKEDPVEKIREMTWWRGADVVIDAVGMEADRTMREKLKATINFEKGSINALETAFRAVRRGWFVSVLGVYGYRYDNFPLHRMFDKWIRLQLGQCPVHNYIDELLQLVADKKVILEDIISHRLPLSEAPRAYQLFNDKEDNCTKVVLQPWT